MLERVASRVDELDLVWLLDILWRRQGAEVATFLDQETAEGWVAVERYLVLPTSRRPLIVVPDGNRRAVLRALLARPALQSRANLLIRATAAALVASPWRRPAGRLVVAAPPAATEHALVVPHLGRMLDADLAALLLLGRRDPNRKPVLELFDARGRTLGFAKVGWNDPTGALVRREALTLTRLHRSAGGVALPRAPQVLHSGDFRGLDLLVTEPLPASARRWSNGRPPPTAAIAAVAAATAAGGRVEQEPLHGLGLWTCQRAALAAVSGPESTSAAVLLRAIDSCLEAVAPGVQVPVGGWHGDWTPWNLATVRGRLWAWDWEHAGEDVPVGFDALHYLFAVSLHVDRVSTAQAAARLTEQSTPVLARLGVPREAAAALVTGYLIERWLRAHRLNHDGGGWDRAIHPAVVDVLQQRDRTR